ncbi:abortive infection family protein, partial [Streptomyces brasiliensis]|uniref:abortive infection family protein n=1 Tax=Streptomyces brasiliensis TaxID=1954 RepID=UPI001E59EAF3
AASPPAEPAGTSAPLNYEDPLKLDAASAPEGPDGSKAVKKILSGAVNIAVGVAELRNQGFGSGHRMASAPSGLGVRHARLPLAELAFQHRELVAQGEDLGDFGVVTRAQQAQGGEEAKCGQVSETEHHE